MAAVSADRRGNLYPGKQWPEQTIDAAVSLMMAVGRVMVEDEAQGNIADILRNPSTTWRGVAGERWLGPTLLTHQARSSYLTR